jgi:cell fate (sporulation/competence/biofilm development) regulator YlbF (YheA/YmcA/DUF963 family)
MCSLSGKLSGFVDGVKNDEDRKDLLEFYLKVTGLCEQVSNQEFDENDDCYRDTIEKIIDTGRVIKAFKENQIKLTEVFDHLTAIIDNVKKISGIENE